MLLYQSCQLRAKGLVSRITCCFTAALLINMTASPWTPETLHFKCYTLLECMFNLHLCRLYFFNHARSCFCGRQHQSVGQLVGPPLWCRRKRQMRQSSSGFHTAPLNEMQGSQGEVFSAAELKIFVEEIRRPIGEERLILSNIFNSWFNICIEGRVSPSQSCDSNLSLPS